MGILPELDRVRVQTLFETLDTNCDRRIAVDDFEHHFPSVRKTLMEVWNFLVEQFDFNHDGVIEPHEFLGHFVIYALYFMKAEPCTAANSGDQLVQWEETFLRNFRRRLVEIESLVRESGQRT